MKSNVNVGEALRERVARHQSVLLRHSDRFIHRVVRAEAAMLAAALERDAALGRISIEDRDFARTELARELRSVLREHRAARAAHWADLPMVH
jgi:hypothetical protein